MEWRFFKTARRFKLEEGWFKYLGVFLGHENLMETNLEGILEKIQDKLTS